MAIRRLGQNPDKTFAILTQSVNLCFGGSLRGCGFRRCCVCSDLLWGELVRGALRVEKVGDDRVGSKAAVASLSKASAAPPAPDYNSAGLT